MTLTHKQQAVLEFIQRYVAEHRQSPFIREIQLGCQIVSYKSVIDRLNALEHTSYIKRAPNKHRSIKLLRKPQGLPLQATEPALEDAGEGVPA